VIRCPDRDAVPTKAFMLVRDPTVIVGVVVYDETEERLESLLSLLGSVLGGVTSSGAKSDGCS